MELEGCSGTGASPGLINVDITPEIAMRLALAFASLLPKGSAIVACRDGTRSARLLKRAMQAGINSGGVDCHDLELVPPAVARFYARSGLAMGGFTVRTSPFDPTSVEIRFFDERGIDIGPGMQRQLERAYYRDDLRRAFHHDIGGLLFPARGGTTTRRPCWTWWTPTPRPRRDRSWSLTTASGQRRGHGALVLGRLGGEVLGSTPLLDEDRLVSTQRGPGPPPGAADRSGPSSGAELGALLDATGERLVLVDGSGRPLDGRTALLAMVALVTGPRRSPGWPSPCQPRGSPRSWSAAADGQVVWTPLSAAGPSWRRPIRKE